MHYVEEIDVVCSFSTPSQRTHDAIMTSLLCQNDVISTLWWLYHYVMLSVGGENFDEHRHSNNQPLILAFSCDEIILRQPGGILYIWVILMCERLPNSVVWITVIRSDSTISASRGYDVIFCRSKNAFVCQDQSCITLFEIDSQFKGQPRHIQGLISLRKFREKINIG